MHVPLPLPSSLPVIALLFFNIYIPETRLLLVVFILAYDDENPSPTPSSCGFLPLIGRNAVLAGAADDVAADATSSLIHRCWSVLVYQRESMFNSAKRLQSMN